MVELRNVTKHYGAGAQGAAVRDVSLTVARGEFFSLLGPSGCGKSTTLRMIAGLEPITEGTLLVDGNRMNDVPARDRDMAMVFQSYALYPHMDVFDNLAFGLRRRGFDRAEIDRRVNAAASMLGLRELARRKPHALSGGQRQRVALGRAIVRDPQVFLFDEPLSNLDASLRASMRSELVALHQRLGTTMIYVTHDQAEAMTMSDRLCIMNQGEVVQVGRPIDVYRNPRSTFVARFLGTAPMNLVPAIVETGPAGPAARIGSVVLPLPRWRNDDLAARNGRPITLGLRPEHLREPGDESEQAARIRVRIRSVEPLGAETMLVADLGDTVLTARVDGSSDVRPQETVELCVRTNELFLFDPESSLAIERSQ